MPAAPEMAAYLVRWSPSCAEYAAALCRLYDSLPDTRVKMRVETLLEGSPHAIFFTHYLPEGTDPAFTRHPAVGAAMYAKYQRQPSGWHGDGKIAWCVRPRELCRLWNQVLTECCEVRQLLCRRALGSAPPAFMYLCGLLAGLLATTRPRVEAAAAAVRLLALKPSRYLQQLTLEAEAAAAQARALEPDLRASLADFWCSTQPRYLRYFVCLATLRAEWLCGGDGDGEVLEFRLRKPEDLAEALTHPLLEVWVAR